MTSYNRKLYSRDPAAAHAFERAQKFEHRITYGKNATLACFVMATPSRATFGQRETPPVLPGYRVFAPQFRMLGESILHGVDSFTVRKEYALYHGLAVTEVVAVRLPAVAEGH